SKLGPLTLQVQPEFVYAQNLPFVSVLTNKPEEILKAYYHTYLNKIDDPERFGTGSYTKVFAGQSSLRYHFKKLSLGVSTENLWWGPGVRNALVMTNNAPGFLHFTLNTTAPLLSPIGTFEGQVVSGWLKRSGYFPDTTKLIGSERLFVAKPDDDRYLNGMVFTWQPKWTKGLHLGVSRVYYVYQSNLQHSVNGYLPIIGRLFKGFGTKEDELKRDEMLSLFFRLVLPNDHAEVYGEFGRNDHSANMRDLLLEPEHSRAYLFGFKKLFPTNKKNTDLELMGEFTSLQMPSTMFVREQESWYAHYQVVDGYTNRGQVMGAGIGPGSNSQTIGLHWVQGQNNFGFLFERIVHNNDFYYTAFASKRDFWNHWVDLSLNLNKSWRHKQYLFDAHLLLNKSLNYHWEREKDVHYFQAGFTVSYFF
ncbi:MAG TPA: capsule assembly Wzi family protein, partial [Flavisolibacter sp.]|nr:capsule assembly Wzi family protein [Flavisolibacter sp.]